MASALATSLRAKLDALEDRRDDLLDEMAEIALGWPFVSYRTADEKLIETFEKLRIVCTEITLISRAWVEASAEDYPPGEWPYKEVLLEREWRKFRKFPRLNSILIELYNGLDKPITGF